jgi:hypothetical protein
MSQDIDASGVVALLHELDHAADMILEVAPIGDGSAIRLDFFEDLLRESLPRASGQFAGPCRAASMGACRPQGKLAPPTASASSISPSTVGRLVEA